MRLQQLGFALATALSIGAVSLPASAASYTFTMPLAPDVPYSSTAIVAGVGPFTDLWNFTAPAGAAAVSGSAISVDIRPWYNIDDMLIQLYETNGNRLIATGSGTGGSKLSEVAVLAGTPYYFSVTGEVTEATAGAYSFLAIAAPIPEPKTYAMWLAGLAVIGFLVARRRAAA